MRRHHRWRQRPRLSAAVLLLAAVCAAAAGSPAGARSPDRPRVHLVTFMNRMDQRFAFLQVSAEAHQLNPMVIGFGMEAWWPDGLGVKINALRQFVMQRVADEDVLIFADAFDAVVMAGEDEILAKFEELERTSNRSLIFNAEEVCYPRYKNLCDPATYPTSPTRWRYLNSGLMVGRGRALKRMLRDPVPNIIEKSDQAWYQGYFRDHNDEIKLDTACVLLCAVWGIGSDEPTTKRYGTNMTKERRIFIPATGELPALVHFVSAAHWTIWEGGKATSPLQDFFRQQYPQKCATLFDNWWFGIHVGSTHDLKIYSGKGWWLVMRLAMCVSCNLLGNRAGECFYFKPFQNNCCWLFSGLILFIALLAALVWRFCFARPGQLADAQPVLSPRALQAGFRRTMLWFRMQLRPLMKRPELNV